MRGLPKVHKPGVPMRPITSGIGSAPHRLAKRLATPLSNRLGSISDAHLRNSSDLIERVKNENLKNKKLASFDVKALFTNVPVEGAIQAVSRVVESINAEELPVPKHDYLKLISLCVKFGAFVFNGEEYRQHRGLSMGSALSPVMACLYMETLETDSFNRIMGRGSKWYRYVDDVLVIIPKNTNTENKVRMLNSVNPDIQFTVEEEINDKLPFLDTIIWRCDKKAKFSVYRKPTNKDDFIHFLSAHNIKTKTGVVIGFFLRALRICSDEYLEEEYKYIIDKFTKLCYPVGLLMKLKKKAINIKNKCGDTSTEKKRYMAVPNSVKSACMDRYLRKTGINIATSSGRKIGDVVRMSNNNKNKNENSVVYSIPCSGCSSVYYGESHRGMETRLKEHKRDVQHHRISNSLVIHIDKHNHLPRWQDAKIIHKGLDKRIRKAMEAAYICMDRKQTTNHREGFLCWAKTGADIAITTGGKAVSNIGQSGGTTRM